MAESTSQRFILELQPLRDALYTQALASARDPSHAEGLLQAMVHATFPPYAQGTAPADLPAWFQQAITAAAATQPPAPLVPASMPAATWSRLCALVQIEASKLSDAKALNPDSVLLSPDPLLAPQKHSPGVDESDGLNLNPMTRFLITASLAILLGVLLTIYVCTRKHPAPPATLPATTLARPSATAP